MGTNSYLQKKLEAPAKGVEDMLVSARLRKQAADRAAAVLAKTQAMLTVHAGTAKVSSVQKIPRRVPHFG